MGKIRGAAAMRIAVCDNEPAICEDIARLIRQEKPDASISIFDSKEALLQSGEEFSILFLDIRGVSGLEIARAIREREARTGQRLSILIFVTAYRDYMEAAFDVHAFHYLLKPLDVKKFSEVLERACREAQAAEEQAERCLLLKIAENTKKVALKDIFFIESSNKKVIVHAEDGIYETYGKMDDLEIALGASFYRSHRCYLVNLAKLSGYGPDFIRFPSGDSILLARKKYHDFVKTYLRYAREGGAVNI